MVAFGEAVEPLFPTRIGRRPLQELPGHRALRIVLQHEKGVDLAESRAPGHRVAAIPSRRLEGFLDLRTDEPTKARFTKSAFRPRGVVVRSGNESAMLPRSSLSEDANPGSGAATVEKLASGNGVDNPRSKSVPAGK